MERNAKEQTKARILEGMFEGNKYHVVIEVPSNYTPKGLVDNGYIIKRILVNDRDADEGDFTEMELAYAFISHKL